jgi:integrase
VPPSASPSVPPFAPLLCRCPLVGGAVHEWSPLWCLPKPYPFEVEGLLQQTSRPEQPTAPRTQDVIPIARKALERRNLKQGTRETWEKRWWQFAKERAVIPTDREMVLTYLDRFESPKYRNNQGDALRTLYQSAVDSKLIATNPLDGAAAARVPETPIYTLTLGQVAGVDCLPMTPRQRVVWELLVGHGWRQEEVARIRVEDVRRIREDGWIWCRGKMRDGWAPILPETADRLRELAGDAPDEHGALRSRGRTSTSYNTVHRDATALLETVGLSLDMHDLRRTCSTLVAEATGDEVLAMRLLRDRVPGVTSRYIRRDLPGALARYSPLRQVRGSSASNARESGGSARESNPPGTGKPAPRRF